MDNGNGLNQETMHKMLRCMYRTCCSLCLRNTFQSSCMWLNHHAVCILIQQYLYFSPSSFGYSDKTTVNHHAPIGIYGNGFKSGSMRLGKDAIVFSKSKRMSCVGMLSQTYLKEINANQIIVPIICLEHTDQNKYILYLMHVFRWIRHMRTAQNFCLSVEFFSQSHLCFSSFFIHFKLPLTWSFTLCKRGAQKQSAGHPAALPLQNTEGASWWAQHHQLLMVHRKNWHKDYHLEPPQVRLHTHTQI